VYNNSIQIKGRSIIMRAGELKNWLKKRGCCKLREGKKHEIWVNPANGDTASVDRHDGQEIPNGTVNSIKKQLGLK
jgi:predicted RNA binding protein YcfA (HicA-like mRNA interferase family)